VSPIFLGKHGFQVVPWLACGIRARQPHHASSQPLTGFSFIRRTSSLLAIGMGAAILRRISIGWQLPENGNLALLVRARAREVYKQGTNKMATHTYLDGARPFICMGMRAVGTFHSTATLSTQRVTTTCMGFGPCTVSIFSCPATATLAGQAVFFFALIWS
jgi:hypothetical protein